MHNAETSEFHRLRKSYADWLGGPLYHWTHFCHFTFRETPGSGCLRYAAAFMRELAETFCRQPLTGFYALEKGTFGSRRHFHALLELPGISADIVRREWVRSYGWAKVYPYNPRLGGLQYVTKYVVKDACNRADWLLYPTEETYPGEDRFETRVDACGYELYIRWSEESHRFEDS